VRRAGTKVQPPAWHACTGGQRAALTVPLDYSDPDGKTVKLALFRIPTKDPMPVSESSGATNYLARLHLSIFAV